MQTTTTAFTSRALSPIRPISYDIRISFDKAWASNVTFFVIDQSLLDGVDVLPPVDDNPIQYWDSYQYLDYSSRLQMVEWSREIEFPSSVSSAMADFTLDNHDSYFTPDSGSVIDQYIIPKRPVRILSGFAGENVPQFVGITEKTPVVDDTSMTAQFHALDFLSQIYTLPITTAIAMQNARTDQVLEVIFQQFGLQPDQYKLDKGSNKIKFVFFERDKNAGNIFKQLMEAEMGNLWLDEAGIIRFTRRASSLQAPIYTFDEANTIDIKTNGDTKIINDITITADIREVQQLQYVYTKAEMIDSTVDTTNLFIVPANNTAVFSASITDPCLSIIEPTLGETPNGSWFTAINANATLVGNVSIIYNELTTNSITLIFENTNSFPIIINKMSILGVPAKIIDHIVYTDSVQDSIDKYEEQSYTIDNPFIQDVSQCQSITAAIFEQYSTYAGQIEINVKGNPAIQLDDIITSNIKTYIGDYRIVKISSRIQDGEFSQSIIARKYVPRLWFVLDQSRLNTTDGVLTP